MTKAETIAAICEINKGAKPERLETFSVEELAVYLDHLLKIELEGNFCGEAERKDEVKTQNE